ncbi:hypothetical protein CHO01_31860 [Cellulomonas hominis]|uniref:Uncharacterized protein n=1 Tax=Cellulomonas hominis TaxID=156981 RepID=A0A511FFP8_9CELL|nr:hypothetical protein [Cellulomonas hominis]MBB5474846.1 hypothetical protein [Cellulomonas hominis]NKY05629.1 hypothetical protein [Cellulomonas hominis]GEL48070.1 hypothetical protein CHO01_31860 [Cellulomonas hominis]
MRSPPVAGSASPPGAYLQLLTTEDLADHLDEAIACATDGYVRLPSEQLRAARHLDDLLIDAEPDPRAPLR